MTTGLETAGANGERATAAALGRTGGFSVGSLGGAEEEGRTAPATGDGAGEAGGGGEEGRTTDGTGAGGRLIGGVAGFAAVVTPAGGIGLGATKGGGRTGAGLTGCESGAGGFDVGAGAPGGRFGRLIRAASFSTGTVGRCGVRGGSVIRTVSFFGSFKSAMEIT